MSNNSGLSIFVLENLEPKKLEPVFLIGGSGQDLARLMAEHQISANREVVVIENIKDASKWLEKGKRSPFDPEPTMLIKEIPMPLAQINSGKPPLTRAQRRKQQREQIKK